mmetsp:Transcript_20027/g.22286  ORF Transcript_20027/g.22286 Transcript_20027/m.22286 type:complete len:275 (+) Transcript_20027:18-842(+)
MVFGIVLGVLACVGVAAIFAFAYPWLAVAMKKGSGVGKYSRSDAWAVITGGSDGIGKEFAFQLAAKGFNILLVSRTMSKLQAVQEEVISRSGDVSCEVVQIDLSSADKSDYDRVSRAMSGKDIAILINNAGLSYKYPCTIEELDENLMDNILKVNVLALTKMCRIAMPHIRSPGLILNISSGSGISPVPLLNVYAASKTYVNYFSLALNAEYKHKGIRVESLTPMFIATKLSGMKPRPPKVPSPETFVKSALSKIGAALVHAGYDNHDSQLYPP